jgi:hypothetical protein
MDRESTVGSIARCFAATLIASAISFAAPALAGEPLVRRSPSGPQTYDVFENNQRVGTIRPDATGKPSLQGVRPLDRSRYTFERSPSAPNGYEVLRDGKRIGSVIQASPPAAGPAPPQAPGAGSASPHDVGRSLGIDRSVPIDR